MVHSPSRPVDLPPEQCMEYTLYSGASDGHSFYCLDFTVIRDVRDESLEAVVEWLLTQLPNDPVRWLLVNPRSINHRPRSTLHVVLALVVLLQQRFDLVAICDYVTDGYIVSHAAERNRLWSKLSLRSLGYGGVAKRWAPDRLSAGENAVAAV